MHYPKEKNILFYHCSLLDIHIPVQHMHYPNEKNTIFPFLEHCEVAAAMTK